MNNFCIWFLCLTFLAAEAVGEVVIFNHSECDGWYLSLAAVVNYVSAWFVFIITHKDEMTSVESPLISSDDGKMNYTNEEDEEIKDDSSGL